MKQKILAPMAGKILQINVKEGDKVEEDDQLLTIEAMKMENPILSMGEGIVGVISAKEGDEVKAEQLLLVIE